LLGGRLALYDVDDVERLAVGAVDDLLRVRNIVLSHHRREDLTAYVIEEVWQASLTYDSARYRRFTTLARTVVWRRAIDWLRADLGRTRWQFHGHTYERELPALVSFNSPDGSELASTLPGEQGEFDAGRADLIWALTQGSGSRLRPQLEEGSQGAGQAPRWIRAQQR
jgi:DNA-directed RNA polymerase specialized sigma24 family protein